MKPVPFEDSLMYFSRSCRIGVVSMLMVSLAQAQVPTAGTSSKPASPSTVSRNQHAQASLPMRDERDLEESRRGFIAAPAERKILDAKGAVAWDMGSYEYLLQGKDFDSIHPSLQRQAVAEHGVRSV